MMIAIKDSADLPVEMMMRYTSYQMGISTGPRINRSTSETVIRPSRRGQEKRGKITNTYSNRMQSVWLERNTLCILDLEMDMLCCPYLVWARSIVATLNACVFKVLEMGMREAMGTVGVLKVDGCEFERWKKKNEGTNRLEVIIHSLQWCPNTQLSVWDPIRSQNEKWKVRI